MKNVKLKSKIKTWRKVKLEKVVDIVYGKDLPTRELKNQGFPVYGGNGIIGYSDKYLYDEPQIIVGCRGAYSGNVFETKPKSFITHNSLILQLKNSNSIDRKFLFYKLLKANIKSTITGSAQPQITITELNQLEIATPNIEKQKRIANILSAFDEKIELNNKISKNLEAIAQAIFKEWFVKFKFPGHEKAKFIDSELGKIPKGWEVKQFGDGIITEVISNGIDKFNGEKIYLATADVDGKEISNTKTKITYDKRPSRADMQPIINSMWFAKMINTYKILFFFDGNKEDLEKFILSTGFMGIKCNNGSEFFMYLFISSKKFHSIKDTLVQGAVQEALTLGNIKRVKILIPSKEVLLRFNEIIKPMFGKIYKNRLENQKLASLRDLLLPKLMSGEIKV